MTKKTDVWMPLYVADYLADTARLTTEQHGAYLLILLDYWRSGPPPDDDAVLCSITRMQLPAWRRAKPALIGFFTIVEGKWRQKRADQEKNEAAENSSKRSEAGKHGADKRWGKTDGKPDGKPDGKRIASAIANGSQRAWQNDAPSPSPSSSLRSEENSVPPGLVESASPPRLPACPVDELVSLYHRHLPTLPRVEILNDTRRKQLAARWREVVADEEIARADDPKIAGIEWFGWFFEHAAKSAFLTGKAKDWRASFDFLVAPSNFAKVIEGNYHRTKAAA